MQWQTITTILIICCTNIILSACQTPRTLPEWQGKEQPVKAEQPIPECDWPELVKEDRTAGEYFVMDAVGFGQQLVCQAAERGNHDIAAANAESIEALINQLNTVNEIGVRQHNMAEFQLDELERDRRDAEVEGWAYKGLLAAVLIAVAL